MRSDSVIFNLMIIGEAVKNLPEAIRDYAPELEWRKIMRFRDYIAHHYWGINLGVIWSIVQEDIPLIKQTIEDILARFDG